MSWYECTAKTLELGKTFTREDLLSLLRSDHPDLSENSFQWAIGGMLKAGMLTRVGYNTYVCTNRNPQQAYSPDYSDQALAFMNQVAGQFPHVQFTVFESVLLNEFLNHLIAQNTIFLQVEKDAAIFVFRFLQDEGRRNILYKPSPKEFTLYWEKDCVVVTDLISEAPISADAPHSMCLEKLLVDLYCDKLISTIYSKAEYEDVITQAVAQYAIDRTKLLRYARRRNKEAEIAGYLDAAGKRE